MRTTSQCKGICEVQKPKFHLSGKSPTDREKARSLVLHITFQAKQQKANADADCGDMKSQV